MLTAIIIFVLLGICFLPTVYLIFLACKTPSKENTQQKSRPLSVKGTGVFLDEEEILINA